MAQTLEHKSGKLFFGESNFLPQAAKKNFSAFIFELLSEREPSRKEQLIFELMLNLSIDHGRQTPSALATIKTARAGAVLPEAVADGMRQINNDHGGAIDDAMKLFYTIKKSRLLIKNIVAKYLKEKKKIPGFGHRIYSKDPRAEVILQTLARHKFNSSISKIAREIEKALCDKSGKIIPLNIDGAIAVVLCTFGWQPRLGKAVFVIARTAGLCGQYLNHCRK